MGRLTSRVVAELGPTGFRSLFSWITLVGRWPEQGNRADRTVSILVLVDHARRLSDDVNGGYRVPVFGSLFLWITLVGLDRTGRLSNGMVLFRSLFSWITLVGQRHLAARLPE